MMNFREIFNMGNSYIGLFIIIGLILLLVLLSKRESIKIFGYSFLGAGVLLVVIYLFGNIIIDSFSYRFFIEIISDNFFSNILIFSGVSLIFGGIGLGIHKFI